MFERWIALVEDEKVNNPGKPPEKERGRDMKLIAPSQGLIDQIIENANLIAEAIETCGTCELAESRSRNLKVFAVRKNQWHARSNPQSSDEGGLD